MPSHAFYVQDVHCFTANVLDSCRLHRVSFDLLEFYQIVPKGSLMVRVTISCSVADAPNSSDAFLATSLRPTSNASKAFVTYPANVHSRSYIQRKIMEHMVLQLLLMSLGVGSSFVAAFITECRRLIQDQGQASTLKLENPKLKNLCKVKTF